MKLDTDYGAERVAKGRDEAAGDPQEGGSKGNRGYHRDASRATGAGPRTAGGGPQNPTKRVMSGVM